MSFQISALDIDQFSHLFGQDEETLARQGIQRIVVDNNPGFPCRVSLRDAEIGEKVLLMNYEHQPLPTPSWKSPNRWSNPESSQPRAPDKVAEIPARAFL